MEPLKRNEVFDFLEGEEITAIQIDRAVDFYTATGNPSRQTRFFLKIQDGCNYICSFCIIPKARGPSRAITIERAKTWAEKAVAKGFREVVLTGVNIGEYSSHRGEKLSSLARAILQIKGIERVRLSSIEPNTIDDELLKVLSDSPKFMPHFHIPLQSGSDAILRQMRRKYTVSLYQKAIDKIGKYFPLVGIGADIICGFPGESKEQFEETHSLLKEIPLTHFHVFPYSRRRGTIADKMAGQISHALKKERVALLRQLGEEKLAHFAKGQGERVSAALFEKKNKLGLWEGYTPQFVRVCTPSKVPLKNKIRQVAHGPFRQGLIHGTIV